VIEEHRDALERVKRDLRKLELSGPVLEKAMQTLRVASVEPELQPLLERGILAEDLTAAGFGLDPSLVRKPVQRERRAPRKADAKPDKETERRRREARTKVAEAEEALTRAENAWAEAARAVDTAREELFRAQRDALDAG
jgi:hypothetical protein